MPYASYNRANLHRAPSDGALFKLFGRREDFRGDRLRKLVSVVGMTVGV